MYHVNFKTAYSDGVKDDRRGSGTHSAKLAGGYDDAPLVQHAGIQVQHVIHVHCHKILSQVPLRRVQTIKSSSVKVRT